jgi:hypothetical protein
MIPGRLPVRILHGLLYFLLFSLVRVFPQHTALVYRPEVQLGAGGPVSYLEERVDDKLTLRAEFVSPGLYRDYIRKGRSDGSLRRLVWQYVGPPEDGNYTIEEQDSQPDGTWTVSAILKYRNGILVHAQFFSGDNLIEEREYEYDRQGRVASETTLKPFEGLEVRLDFERPSPGALEAYESQPDGTKLIVARMEYDAEDRLSVEERFAKGELTKRDVYTYDTRGKLIDHVRYDDRELPVRRISYTYTSEGLPASVMHRDIKDRILYGISYTREQFGDYSKTIVKNSSGEVTGTIDYVRKNGMDVSRTEVFLLGSAKLEITYSDFDGFGNWRRKEHSTYGGGSLKEKTVTSRIIRYFD